MTSGVERDDEVGGVKTEASKWTLLVGDEVTGGRAKAGEARLEGDAKLEDEANLEGGGSGGVGVDLRANGSNSTS